MQAAKWVDISEKDAALLESRSVALRQYLMEQVVPTLALGLQEVKSTDPEDYVDHLVRVARCGLLSRQCNCHCCLHP
jgi:hypothetical protein